MEVELVSNLLTRNLWMAGDLKMMLSPKIGNLLPVEGLNNFLSFFFGGSGCTQRDCNHPVFPKNWRKCPSVRQSWRLSFGPDHPGWCKSNGRLGRMCKLVCHFDQTLRIRVWYIYISYLYLGYIYHKSFHYSCRSSYTSPIHGSYMEEGTKKGCTVSLKFLTHFFNCKAHPNERQTFYRHANQLWEP